MFGIFSAEAREVMQLAYREALRRNHEQLGTGHLLLGLFEGSAKADRSILRYLDLDPGKICLVVDDVIGRDPDHYTGFRPRTSGAQRALEYAVEEARDLGDESIERDHLLLGLLREGEDIAASILLANGLDLEAVRQKVRWWRNLIDPAWLGWNGSTVTRMAFTISAGRSWEDLPILADAVEEAGCDDAELLSYLRSLPDEGVALAVVNLILRHADSKTIASMTPPKRWWQWWKKNP